METRISFIQSIIELMWSSNELNKSDGTILVKKMIEKFEIQMENKVSC
jgi:hypothetical protein